MVTSEGQSFFSYDTMELKAIPIIKDMVIGSQ